ncbi:hypothetical protein RQP52_07160 [Paenibacillus sp. PFR10]|uniref:Uncharacterized protein n=1 Tax=Paenibacillus violae TaxID=3077234 RepID=A0ABU3R9B5_9BACL|nr:hypothetical protein [Paenibacillus sp. PFR10]MDU0200864.1 hypothetical protein [Paenibacillus sp. PFR10]
MSINNSSSVHIAFYSPNYFHYPPFNVTKLPNKAAALGMVNYVELGGYFVFKRDHLIIYSLLPAIFNNQFKSI